MSEEAKIAETEEATQAGVETGQDSGTNDDSNNERTFTQKDVDRMVTQASKKIEEKFTERI